MATRQSKGSAGKLGPVRNLLSLALFAIAAVLFIVVGVLYFRDENKDPGVAPTPVSEPGHAQLKNVYDALAAKDLDVDYARGPVPRFASLTPPSQGLVVNGLTLAVFIYDDPALREEDTSLLTPEDLVPATSGGASASPAAGTTPHGVGGSNIYVILLGGDDETIAKVDQAIQGLP